MGNTAEKIAEKHGTVELVVLHNAVPYRDPDDFATDPREYAYRVAYRGERITVDKIAAERLLELGSAAKPDDEKSGFAEAGMRDPSVLAAPPSAAAVSSPESQQVGAIKAVVQDRVGEPGVFDKLDLHQMRQVAVAFGVDFKESDDKAALLEAIFGEAPDPAAGAVGTIQQTDLRVEDHVARMHKKERGGSKKTDDDNGGSSEEGGATDSAQALAAEHGVDLSQIQGTGTGGRITQPDVTKYLAEQQGS